MKKRSISLIITLMSFALLGVMAMQLYFLRESYSLKTQLFNQSVNTALSNVVAKLGKQDAFNFLDNKERQQREINMRRRPVEQRFVKVKSIPAQAPEDNTTKIARVDEALPPVPPGPVSSLADNRVVPARTLPVDKRKTIVLSTLGKHLDDSTGVSIARINAREAGKIFAAERAGRGFTYSRRPGYNQETESERYARLLQSEQFKSDSLFQVRDSLLWKKFNVKAAFKNVQLDENEQLPPVKLNINVVEYQNALGEIKQQQYIQIVPQDEAIMRAQNSRRARRDTIVRYMVEDPVEGGVKMITIPKLRITQVSPQLLEENHTQAKIEAKRVNKFVADRVKSKSAMQDLVNEFQRVDMPLKNRVKFTLLDSLLKVELAAQGLDIPYQYKVSTSKLDTIVFLKASAKQNFIPENTYQTKLFPTAIVTDAGLLTLTFPGKINAIFSNMSVMMGSSAGLLLILLFCFGYTIHSILRQKKISEMKTDFINNMTHEFKTPVATIMIASEALRDPEVTEDKSRISRLAGIIYDENVRLGNHIERVLNIAKIDKDDLKLDHAPVDMNELVAAITDSMDLQLRKKDATIRLDLRAQPAIVNGDELHLSNVIFNLVDNAIKYSGDQPKISITTLTAGKYLLIRIADNGIGMNRDQLSKIFDQFYRIPTGNVHDVKGFGLGLSYVNNIITRLRGTIRVKSERDKGSEFEISLPLSTHTS